MSSKRGRDLRNGFTLPLALSLCDRVEAATRHPRWVWDYLTYDSITFANLSGLQSGQKVAALAAYVNRELNGPRATYEDLARLRETGTDRCWSRACSPLQPPVRPSTAGPTGVIVSNHGGRQLDYAPPTIDVLAEIGDHADVLLRQRDTAGSDVVKARALGAKACLMRRPWLWGVAAVGQPGSPGRWAILREEIDICLALLGVVSVQDLHDSIVGSAMPVVS